MEAIVSRFEAIASRFEAIAIRNQEKIKEALFKIVCYCGCPTFDNGMCSCLF